MPQWEVCHIEMDSRVEAGFLSKKTFTKWTAVADTLNGKQIVEQTPEWEDIDFGKYLYDLAYKKSVHFRSVLVGRLLASGWEPIVVENGQVTTLRRLIP